MTEQVTERSIYAGGALSDLKQAWGAVARSFDFTGRATRTELAAYYIASTVLLVVVAAVVPADLALGPRGLMEMAIGLALLVPLPAAIVRRLHDRDTPGYGALIFVAWTIAAKYSAWRDYSNGPHEGFDPFEAYPVIGWVLAAALLVLLVVLLQPGTVGPNRFGPDPRGRD